MTKNNADNIQEFEDNENIGINEKEITNSSDFSDLMRSSSSKENSEEMIEDSLLTQNNEEESSSFSDSFKNGMEEDSSILEISDGPRERQEGDENSSEALMDFMNED